jgi:trehalose 6-phosphate synthase/phosphatase
MPTSEPGRLLIVSNRLPVTVRHDGGRASVVPSSGGLATGLRGPHEKSGGLWIGWPGPLDDVPEQERAALTRKLTDDRLVPIALSADEIRRYYDGFSNGFIWPVFHYLAGLVPLHDEDWETYAAVNRRFADEVARLYRPGDRIWVHDYQLMLLPGFFFASFAKILSASRRGRPFSFHICAMPPIATGPLAPVSAVSASPSAAPTRTA